MGPMSIIKPVEKESPLLMTVVWKDDLKNCVPSPLPSSQSKKPIVPKLRLNTAQSSHSILNTIYSDSSNIEGTRFKKINTPPTESDPELINDAKSRILRKR